MFFSKVITNFIPDVIMNNSTTEKPENIRC